ncbi:MAG: J domain-containing protein [Candidatus Micrarchaeia archaeon]
MNIQLLKYHVLRCPKCGHLKTSTTMTKTRCVSCMHGWEIHKDGNTWGVLASFYTPAQASEYIQKLKIKRAQAQPASPQIDGALNVLGLKSGCTREEFVQEYRKKAFMYHPDAHKQNPNAQEQFKQVIEAAQQVRSAMGWQ